MSKLTWVAWIAGLITVVIVARVVGDELPWHLDDRLRCAVAFQATVGRLGCEDDVIAAHAHEGAIVRIGQDPWGHPFFVGAAPTGSWISSLFSPAGPRARAGSLGRDGVESADDVSVPGLFDPCMRFARDVPGAAVLVAIFGYVALTAAWGLALAPRSRAKRIAALLALPAPAALVAGFTIAEGVRALGVAVDVTPLGGWLTPYLSAYLGLLVVTAGVHLASAHRVRSHAAPAA